MGRILMSGGGGVDLDVVTAAADDILSGKVIVDQNGDPLTGILTLSGNAGAGDVLTGKTFYNTNAKSKITGTMQTMSGGTYTPKSSQQTISCNGKKMTSDVIIKGDGNLTANNILYGKSIFGVSGNVRKFGFGNGRFSTAGHKYFDNARASGQSYLPYLKVVPGFTPRIVTCFMDGDESVSATYVFNAWTVRNGSSPQYVVKQSSFSASELIIPVYKTGTYNIEYAGYY